MIVGEHSICSRAVAKVTFCKTDSRGRLSLQFKNKFITVGAIIDRPRGCKSNILQKREEQSPLDVKNKVTKKTKKQIRIRSAFLLRNPDGLIPLLCSSSVNFAGTKATGTNCNGLRCTVNDRLYLADIGFPSSVCFAM